MAARRGVGLRKLVNAYTRISSSKKICTSLGTVAWALSFRKNHARSLCVQTSEVLSPL